MNKFFVASVLFIFLILVGGVFADPTINVAPTVIDAGQSIQIFGHCDNQNPSCSIFESLNGGATSEVISGLTKNADYNELLILVDAGTYVFNTCKQNETHCSPNSLNVIVAPSTPISVDVNDLNTSIVQLEQHVNDLNAQVIVLESQVNDLNNEIIILQNKINDLNAQDANFAAELAYTNTLISDNNIALNNLQTQVNDLNTNLQSYIVSFDNRLNDLNSYIQYVDQNLTAEINIIKTQITDLNTKIDDVNSQLTAQIIILSGRIDALDTRLTALESTILAMNHGTINLFFDEGAMTLRVYGEAPNTASDANIQIVGGTVVGLDANNNYTGTIDVSTYLPQTYNVVVSFGGMTSLYNVSAIFNDLLIIDMNARLTALEDKVEKLDDGTIEFDYNSINNKLTIGGEAPTTAACAMIDVYTNSGTAVTTFNASVIQDPASVDYSKKFSTGSWAKEALDIYVSFYTSSDCSTGFIQTGYDVFDGLLGEDLEGFRNIVASSYVTSFYVNEVKLPVTYGLKVDVGGQYSIEYQLNGGTWTLLKAPTNFDEGRVKYQTEEIDITKLGVNRIKLRAVNSSGQVKYTSFQFKVRHADLKDKLNAKTTITKPNNNSKLTYHNPTSGLNVSLPYPFGSIADKVYWTQSGNVPLIARLVSNTTPSSTETFFRFVQPNGNKHTSIETITNQADGNDWLVDGNTNNFRTTFPSWDNNNMTNEQYTTIEVCFGNVAQAEACADRNIGIDNTEPLIGDITPTLDINMSGIYHWTANITDDLSGIKNVKFYLIEKTDVNYCKISNPSNCHLGIGAIKWSTKADFNTDLSLFQADLNTLKYWDGDYNVAFEAIDVAGNYTYKEIDPIIDNTAPVITINSITTPVRRRVDSIDINVDVNDKFLATQYSGVDKVWATLTNTINPADTNTIFLIKDGNYYVGTFVTTIDFNLNNYNVQIDANDNAGNNAIPKNQNSLVIQNYYFNIDTTKTGTANVLFTMDGNFRDDLGSSGPFVDGNMILITSSIVNDTNVIFDENGWYTITTDSLGAGTYYIDLNYNTKDYNYQERITITVNSPSSNPPASPGGGGPAGNPRDTNTLDTNTPEEPVVESPPVEEIGPTGNENPPVDNTPTEGNGLTVVENPTPNTGTGLFAYGLAFPELGSLGLLVIAALALILAEIRIKRLRA